MNSSKVINHIVDWLKSYALESGVKGFVVGISGGIDSAVTSELCAKTGMPTLCVEMPIYQDESQANRGRKHIERMKSSYSNVNSVEIELTNVFDAFVTSTNHDPKQMNEMSLVNSRARLRMTALYYYAAQNNFLVAGTGNKVEDFGVGFFTKYGDGGVDLSPIADLLKTEVFALAKELGTISEIQEAAPTDGLWGDDRTDEDQIGASYPELEWAMAYVDSNSDEKLSIRQKVVLEIYTRLNRINQHKMNPIPVCEIPIEFK